MVAPGQAQQVTGAILTAKNTQKNNKPEWIKQKAQLEQKRTTKSEMLICAKDSIIITPIATKIKNSQIQWFGHVRRRPSDHPISLAYNYNQMELDPQEGLGRDGTNIYISI